MDHRRPLGSPEHNHPSGPQPQAYLLQNHASQPRPHHSLGRGSTSLESYQMGFSGGPLLPNPLSQPFALPHPSGGLYLPHQGHWASHSMQAPIPPNYSGMMNMSGGLRYELMPALPAVGSGYPLQPPESNPGMGLHVNPGLEANTPTQNRYISVPYYVGPPPPMHQREQVGLDPLPATSNRRLALSRAARSQSFYSPSSPPLHHDFTGPPPHRRSTYSSRARRSSLNTRPIPPGLSRDTEVEAVHNSNGHLLGYRASQEPASAAENGLTRPLPKILSMELVEHYSSSIRIEDLPEQDRECSICYNKYGVETPEGIRESPRRFPKCKHVFGDYCLGTWLEQSHSCPYCRDKLPLRYDPEIETRRAQAYMSFMRARARFPAGSPDTPGLRQPNPQIFQAECGTNPFSRRSSQERHDEEEVGEAQDVAVHESPLHRSGESELPTVDGENTPSDSSSAPASPNRASLRDVSRFSQWSSRQRGNRRLRGSRGNLPPPQPLQSDGPTQSSATVPNANPRENEISPSPADAGRGLAEASMAQVTTEQNRNRPW